MDMNETPPKKYSGFLAEIIRFALVAVLIVLPVRLFIAQPFIVSGSSMDPTFLNGDYLIVDELTYRFEDPQRGDVVIFKFPQDTSKFFIKRVIGLPGETVAMAGGSITIYSGEYQDGLTLDEAYVGEQSRSKLRVTLGESEYFVMGDNRPASSDSRIWGPLSEDLIVGRAFLRLLPVTKAQLLPGEERYE